MVSFMVIYIHWWLNHRTRIHFYLKKKITRPSTKPLHKKGIQASTPVGDKSKTLLWWSRESICEAPKLLNSGAMATSCATCGAATPFVRWEEGGTFPQPFWTHDFPFQRRSLGWKIFGGVSKKNKALWLEIRKKKVFWSFFVGEDIESSWIRLRFKYYVAWKRRCFWTEMNLHHCRCQGIPVSC